MTASTVRPSWLPPEGTHAARLAGKWWDAIQIDGSAALAILAHLGELASDGVGPVLCDASGPRLRLHFLVPPRTVALGAACYITVPGDEEQDGPDGLHWVTPPGGIPEHVNPELLRQAIASRGAAS